MEALTYLAAWHFLELPWHFGGPAGAVVWAWTGAPLGGGDEAEDSCCEPFEFNDGRAGTWVFAVLCGKATLLGDGSGERPVCAAVPGGTASVVSPGESGTVGGAGRGRIWGAGRLLHESLGAVASAHSGRNSKQAREHENREHCCHHDGCAHDACTHHKCLAHRVASLAVTRRAALRPCAPEALGVPRRTVLFARLRERFDSRQEIVIASSHDCPPPSHRIITCPPPYTAVRPANVLGGFQGRQRRSNPVTHRLFARTRRLTPNPEVANAMRSQAYEVVRVVRGELVVSAGSGWDRAPRAQRGGSRERLFVTVGRSEVR